MPKSAKADLGGANPESIITGLGYGFRVPSLRSGPGMTTEGLARFEKKSRCPTDSSSQLAPRFCSMGRKDHDVIVDKVVPRSMDRDKTGDVSMTKSDEDAIRDIELRFNEAWGRHDPDGMIESLVDDAQFVTVNGAWTKSRDGFRDLMRRLHGPNGPFRSSTRETPEMHVRFLGPDVAVAHTRFHIYGDVDESERTSIGTRVVRKLDGRWRTVAVQNTDLRPGRRH
jgi:uncharacterized protein (TIGR02246 family)